jgi:hypothetical protein
VKHHGDVVKLEKILEPTRQIAKKIGDIAM